MTRTVKTSAERQQELVEIALRLFLEKGYEATTISEVIAATGLSKGAFYHHFAAKEDLLEAIAVRIVDDSLSQIDAVLNDRGLNAFERLDAYFAHASSWKSGDGQRVVLAFARIFRPDNLLLYHRLHLAVMKKIAPVLGRIIAEGVADQVFDTPDAETAAELLVLLNASTHDLMARLVVAKTLAERNAAADALDRRLLMVGIAADRLLGLPDGSVRFAVPGFAQDLARLLPALEDKGEAHNIVPLMRS
ncbi:TetR/AcrR family transcriptional regulator [Devosia enhydra]|uniref:TetR/AcrR family transcriptional regulator n=1 Tax=Devosia enhydra TaxID=665118 RepID=UPI000931E3BC|nr:TetR family transcriptional regulator [Devosia enhydra]